MDVQRNGNRIVITEPLGFDFDDGRLVLSLTQARDLEKHLSYSRSWLFDEVETENEDG